MRHLRILALVRLKKSCATLRRITATTEERQSKTVPTTETMITIIAETGRKAGGEGGRGGGGEGGGDMGGGGEGGGMGGGGEGASRMEYEMRSILLRMETTVIPNRDDADGGLTSGAPSAVTVAPAIGIVKHQMKVSTRIWPVASMGGGGGGGVRGPQSVQSVPRLHAENSDPGPPSLQIPSEAVALHVSVHVCTLGIVPFPTVPFPPVPSNCRRRQRSRQFSCHACCSAEGGIAKEALALEMRWRQ
jgi:hypothetical protein